MRCALKVLVLVAGLMVPRFLLAQSAGEADGDASKMEAVADKQLNEAYQHLIKSIRDGGGANADLDIEALRESQRAWLKYRDAQVAFVGTHADVGSASARDAGMASYSIVLTKQRIKDLEDVPNPGNNLFDGTR